jgi:hypothetical protein
VCVAGEQSKCEQASARLEAVGGAVRVGEAGAREKKQWSRRIERHRGHEWQTPPTGSSFHRSKLVWNRVNSVSTTVHGPLLCAAACAAVHCAGTGDSGGVRAPTFFNTAPPWSSSTVDGGGSMEEEEGGGSCTSWGKEIEGIIFFSL